MSALAELSDYLQKFNALPHHENPALAKKLEQVQEWQRARMRKTHAKLFSEDKHKPLADYFLNHLYGGDTLDSLVSQLERLVPKAKKLEKLAPKAALQTGTSGINMAITATELDVHLAEWLLEHDLEVTAENMLKAYQSVNDADARRAQINDLRDVFYRTDKYLNSFMLRKAFSLAKGKAYKANYQSLYDFIGAGFEALKPVKSVEKFIEPFYERELAMIDAVHKPDSTPAVFDK